MAGNSKPRKKSPQKRVENVPQRFAGAVGKLVQSENAKHQATVASSMHQIMQDPNLTNEEREKLLAELQEMKGQSITPLASGLTASLMKKVNR